MAGAGWESQPAHRAPSSVTVEAETSMSRQEGPVGRRKLQSCRFHPDGSLRGVPRAVGALTHCGVGRQGLMGQHHLEGEGRLGSVFSQLQLALCRKLAGPQGKRVQGRVFLMRAKHPPHVPTITTHTLGEFVFPFSKNLAYLGNWHFPFPWGAPSSRWDVGVLCSLGLSKPASPSYLGGH